MGIGDINVLILHKKGRKCSFIYSTKFDHVDIEKHLKLTCKLAESILIFYSWGQIFFFRSKQSCMYVLKLCVSWLGVGSEVHVHTIPNLDKKKRPETMKQGPGFFLLLMFFLSFLLCDTGG